MGPADGGGGEMWWCSGLGLCANSPVACIVCFSVYLLINSNQHSPTSALAESCRLSAGRICGYRSSTHSDQSKMTENFGQLFRF